MEQFTVSGPPGLESGWNLYHYAPNPLSWVDPLGLSNLSTTFKAMFREAKRKLGIPKNKNTPQAVKLFDSKYENRTVWEFNYNGDTKYIIIHENDIFCRDPHLHTADDLHEKPLKKMSVTINIQDIYPKIKLEFQICEIKRRP